VIMLAGIWYGSMYGGSITSILLRVPGESASVMVAIDGYELTKQGRAGAALGMSMFSAFIAGMFGLLGLGLVAPTLAEFALDFGPPEYFALTLLGLTLVSYLATDSMWKAVTVTLLGLLLGTVGLDPVRSTARFTFGSLTLQSGIDLVPMVMGLFGISEVFRLLEEKIAPGAVKPVNVPKGLIAVLPNRQDWRDARRAIGQGSLVGFFVGLLPGGGATISSYVAYAVAKRWGKRSQKFGHGAIAGVAAPESAANAATCSGFIPLLTLGLPDNVVMALILGAFMLHGVQPGPQVLVASADMVYTVFASLFLGLALMCLIGYFAIRPLVKILDFPEAMVSAYVLSLCFIGALSIRNNVTDLWLMIGFGVLGYLFERWKFPVAPLVLGVILGPLAEESFKNSMISYSNDWTVFFTRPIAGTMMALTILVLALPMIQRWRRTARRPLQA